MLFLVENYILVAYEIFAEGSNIGVTIEKEINKSFANDSGANLNLISHFWGGNKNLFVKLC